MDACAMVARCHQHQWPEQYGRPPVVGPELGLADARALASMVVDRGPVAADDGAGWA
jgi:hypothetical protein